MTESAAICQYVAARYAPQTLAVAVDDPDYGAYLNFMHMGEATLTFPQTIFFRYSALEPLKDGIPPSLTTTAFGLRRA
jgi:glutathione S-transferase